jgi:hypothetical protein
MGTGLRLAGWLGTGRYWGQGATRPRAEQGAGGEGMCRDAHWLPDAPCVGSRRAELFQPWMGLALHQMGGKRHRRNGSSVFWHKINQKLLG